MRLRAFDIETRPCPNCRVCGSKGVLAYEALTDRLFGVSGTWNVRKCADARCGTYWLDPMPRHEELPKLYRHYYTHEHATPRRRANRLVRLLGMASTAYLQAAYQYGSSLDAVRARVGSLLVHINPLWRANLDFEVFHLSANPGGRLLEVGCGAGTMLDQMTRKGWQTVGVDFDERAVATARSKGRTAYLGGIEQQNFQEESFDAVVMNHVIEHVVDPRNVLAECKKLLREGGKLVAITPNARGHLHAIFRENWRGLEPPRHLNLFSPQSLSNLASSVGFSKITVKTSVHGAPYFWLASRELRDRGLHSMHGEPKSTAKLLAHVVALCLAFANKITDRGEEIVLICSK